MKKEIKILILLLLTFVLLSGNALADDNNEETDENIPYIEITEGEIEFKVDIFGYDKITTEEEVDDFDEEEEESEDGEFDWSEVDREDYSELDFSLITKLIYEF